MVTVIWTVPSWPTVADPSNVGVLSRNTPTDDPGSKPPATTSMSEPASAVSMPGTEPSGVLVGSGTTQTVCRRLSSAASGSAPSWLTSAAIVMAPGPPAVKL